VSSSTNYIVQSGYWYGGKLFLGADVNETGNTSLGDIVYLINYLFKFGPEPDPMYGADTNGDGKVSLSDIVWLINYIFKFGPSPVC
ncbi:MAG: dockerin type I domain-containing protein, partial [candidate division Zixibacteria bacterium]|nr:dockerin type I domain-containing protein [candidate division Zixibacteria bacterium]